MVVDEFPERTAVAVRSVVLQDHPPQRLIILTRPGAVPGEVQQQLQTLSVDASIPCETVEAAEGRAWPRR